MQITPDVIALFGGRSNDGALGTTVPVLMGPGVSFLDAGGGHEAIGQDIEFVYRAPAFLDLGRLRLDFLPIQHTFAVGICSEPFHQLFDHLSMLSHQPRQVGDIASDRAAVSRACGLSDAVVGTKGSGYVGDEQGSRVETGPVFGAGEKRHPQPHDRPVVMLQEEADDVVDKICGRHVCPGRRPAAQVLRCQPSEGGNATTWEAGVAKTLAGIRSAHARTVRMVKVFRNIGARLPDHLGLIRVDHGP